MSKYSTKTAEANGERTIGQASINVGLALWELQGRNTNHTPNIKKIVKRTSSRKHYRVPIELVEVLGLEAAEPNGLVLTEPPASLVTVDAMINGLESYARDNGCHKMTHSICAMFVGSQQKMQEIHYEEI